MAKELSLAAMFLLTIAFLNIVDPKISWWVVTAPLSVLGIFALIFVVQLFRSK